MRNVSALLLLVVLLGGLGASSVHRAQHGMEWAEAQQTHAEDHHETGGEHVSVPCVGGDLHALDCAVCSGLTGTVVARGATLSAFARMERGMVGDEVAIIVRGILLAGRGPPLVA